MQILVRLYNDKGDVIHRFVTTNPNLDFNERVKSLKNLFPQCVRVVIDIAL